MGESLKAVIALVTIVAGIAAGVLWFGGARMPASEKMIIAIVSTFVFIAGAALLAFAQFRKDKAPDLLAVVSKPYFERDGLCFAIVPVVEAGQCWYQIFFQNRLERPCETRIVVRPSQKSFRLKRIDFPTIDITIPCEGGAFGVARLLVPIPEMLQGKMLAFEIGAHTDYANGPGQMLRYRSGLQVGRVSQAVSAALTVGLLFTGTIYTSRPASWRIRLPVGVRSDGEPQPYDVQHLWRPGDAFSTADVVP
jgi:hypothetical protein